MMRHVPPSGPKTAPIAFVGEAPGAMEVKQNRPFVGDAGRIFTELLSSVGINRNVCYITNVVKERPEKNNIKLFLDTSRKHVVMTDEYLRYEQELRTELEQTSANVIVAVGGTALWALCRLKKIEKRRGSILESTLLPGRKVIPIIHPSAVLRYGNYIKSRFISIDLDRILEESKTPDIWRDSCEYNIVTNFGVAILEMKALILGLEKNEISRCAFDIESDRHSHQLTAFGFSYKIYTGERFAFSIGFINEQGNVFDNQQELEIMKLLQEALSLSPTNLNDPLTARYVMQNGMFDATMMYRRYGIVVEKWLDTMVCSRMINPDYPAGLDFITSVYTKMPYFKDEGKESDAKRIDDSYGLENLSIKINNEPITDHNLTSWQRWLLYNAKDCAATDRAIDGLLEDVRTLKAEEAIRSYINVSHPLMYMSERGVRLNLEKMESKRQNAEKVLAEEEAKFLEITNAEMKKRLGSNFTPINSQSSVQVMNYFYTTLGLKPYVSRQTGNPTVDAEALTRLARRDVPGAKELLKMRKQQKLIGTYFGMNIPKDGRLHGSYDPIGSKQGRLSSSKTIFGEGGNLQNQPKEIKALMSADEGCIIFECDLSQAENRVVAYCGQEHKMIAAFESGQDIHSTTAHLIWPELSVEEIVELNKKFSATGDPKFAAPIANRTKSHRFWGKKGNHELNYGMGAAAFSMICEIPQKEGKLIHTKYHRGYPGVRRYQEYVESCLHKNRTIVNPFGRPIKYMEKMDTRLYNRAYSYIPQSTVAWIMNNFGLINIYKTMNKDVDLLLQTHDSITFQINLDVGLPKITNILHVIKKNIEVDIPWQQSSFRIPLDVQGGFTLGTLKEIDMSSHDATEQCLRELVYKL